MQNIRNLFQLSTEIEGVAMVIAELRNQLDNSETDILNPNAMKSAFKEELYIKEMKKIATLLEREEKEKLLHKIRVADNENQNVFEFLKAIFKN